MMKPRRIKVERRAGWRLPPGAIYVGRPSVWGNPWRPGLDVPDARVAVAVYERALLRGELRDRAGRALRERVGELRGRDLACWCKPKAFCHADVLLRLANARRSTVLSKRGAGSRASRR